MRRRWLGMRARLAAAIFTASALVTLAGAVAVAVYEYTELHAEVVERVRSELRGLRPLLVRALATGDVDAVGELVRALEAGPGPERLVAYGPEGRALFAYQRGRPLALESVPPVPDAERVHRGEILRLVEPVRAGGRVLGRVLVDYRHPAPRQHLLAYLRIGAPLLLVLLLLSAALALALQRHLSGPLLTLAAAARRIGHSRDFAQRVPTALPGEIGTLAEDVNRMLADLEAAHEALARQERLHRTVLDHVEEVVYRVRVEGDDPTRARVEFVSRRVASILGIAPEAFMRDPGLWLRRIHPEDQAAVQALTERMLHTGRPVVREYRIRDAAGRWRWMEDHVTPERDGRGRLVAFTGVARDVTERRRWTAALERLVAVVEELLDHVTEEECLHRIVAGTARELIDADVTALSRRQDERTCRYVAVDGMDVGLRAGLCFSLEEGGLCGWVAAHGEPVRVGDILDDPRVSRDQAAALGLRAALVVPMVDEGRVVGGISAFRREPRPFSRDDERLLMLLAGIAAITLRMHQVLAGLEDRVRERTEELAALNRELESFAYTVSHDLRAPLRAIDGFSLALLEDEGERLDAEGREHLRRIRAAAQRMARLIDALLGLAQVTRGEVRMEVVDLSALAHEVLESLRRIHPGRRVEAVVRAGARVRGDPRLLWTLMENLIGNAWKFTRDREVARIEFGWEERDGERVYYVRDNGVGFDMAYADKLFRPFQRLHSTSEFEGTGIGLAAVRRVVERHGGRVWAEGAPDAGATIYFTLARRVRRVRTGAAA